MDDAITQGHGELDLTVGARNVLSVVVPNFEVQFRPGPPYSLLDAPLTLDEAVEELRRFLPQLLELRKRPPVAASAQEKARIEASYRRLNDFYEISILGLRGDREGWEAKVESFLRNADPNAYYDWFFGR